VQVGFVQRTKLVLVRVIPWLYRFHLHLCLCRCSLGLSRNLKPKSNSLSHSQTGAELFRTNLSGRHLAPLDRRHERTQESHVETRVRFWDFHDLFMGPSHQFL